MSSREEKCLLCIFNTAQAWVRRNPLVKGDMLLSLTAADLAQLGEASGEYDTFWRMWCEQQSVKDTEQAEDPQQEEAGKP